ncbi:hypothetical protein MtrunA17_Chr2g0322431 [Medicago truncatula]|uniref:Transmembrane protein n=1 Tax=Medicago truncatula TaxID=3880 RepID=A2Q4H5_MEDTR|nr:hypothetical protein MtrDRAFT_AC157488g17v2 [Medicago truncatula]RHN75547.1 hypothetical protein MtrunA17_Chr2g0322431 [Medicago truncatula]
MYVVEKRRSIKQKTCCKSCTQCKKRGDFFVLEGLGPRLNVLVGGGFMAVAGLCSGFGGALVVSFWFGPNRRCGSHLLMIV